MNTTVFVMGLVFTALGVAIFFYPQIGYIARIGRIWRLFLGEERGMWVNKWILSVLTALVGILFIAGSFQ